MVRAVANVCGSHAVANVYGSHVVANVCGSHVMANVCARMWCMSWVMYAVHVL